MNNKIKMGAVSPVKISGEYSKPRITKKGITIVIASWCVYTLLEVLPHYLKPNHIPFLSILFWESIHSAVKLITSIPVWFIVIRWMYRKKWYWKTLAHLFLFPAYGVLNSAYQYYEEIFIRSGIYGIPVKDVLSWIFYFNLLTYIIQFAIYHGYEILRELRIKERVALQLSALQKEQELATLKSQINPHFLFNTLNSISAKASTDAEGMRTMIAQLADMLRHVINDSKDDLIPLKEELQFVSDYIDLESVRMGDRLSTEFMVDQSLTKYLIPPMIIQPLVENAIKHGISPLKEGGKVTVQINKNKNKINFRVADTGVGLNSADPLSKANGIGLKNIDSRLQIFYGDSAGLKIRSNNNSGCEVTFSLPLK